MQNAAVQNAAVQNAAVQNAAVPPEGDENLLTAAWESRAERAAISDYYKTLGNKGARPELAAPWVFR
jgi:hypothetical protein